MDIFDLYRLAVALGLAGSDALVVLAAIALF